MRLNGLQCPLLSNSVQILRCSETTLCANRDRCTAANDVFEWEGNLLLRLIRYLVELKPACTRARVQGGRGDVHQLRERRGRSEGSAEVRRGGHRRARARWHVVEGARRGWRADRALTWRGVRCAEIGQRALREPSGTLLDRPRGAAEHSRRAPGALGNDH